MQLLPSNAGDFTASKTTEAVNADIQTSIFSALRKSPPTFPRDDDQVTVRVRSVIPDHIKSLGTADDPLRMDFDLPAEVPGNIAGDVGKEQTSCEVGAKPSPFNDNRTLRGNLLLDLDPATDTLTVTPELTYVVKDTIDLCPGNCGTGLEQLATVPISRWEATGISGDVPFTVTFDSGMSSFEVQLKGPPARETPG